MATKNKKNSLLCPNCRRLVSRSDSACPYCGLKHPGSFWKDNLLTRGIKGDKSILEILLVVNIAMFVFSLLIDPSTSSFVGNPFSFLAPTTRSLWVLGATGTIPLFQSGHWWSLIAASFLHGGLVHIAFNMIALYQLEPLVIDIYGNNRTIAIYILAGVAGFFLSALAGVGLTIGASASICGLIGALLYYGWNRGGTYGKAIFTQIGSWAIGIVLFGFLVPGINNWAHGGGMASGFALAALLGYRERRPERIGHTLLGMLCIVATVLVLAWSCFNGVLLLLSSHFS